MTSINARVLREVLSVIDEFVAGGRSVAEVQEHLESSLNLLERGQSVGRVLRAAEADLEEIQFTKLRDEQRPAAILRLDAVVRAIRSELAD